MSVIQHSIDVGVPLRHVYDQWTQFEEFPRFMAGVESVRQVDDSHLHWIASVAGRRKEWDAVITEQDPDRRVAWTSTEGARNAGTVEFARLGDNRTRVILTMEVEPEGGVEAAGDTLGIPSGQVKGNLEKFKDFIEERGAATGGWRGEIEGGRVSEPGHGASGQTGGSSLSGGNSRGARPGGNLGTAQPGSGPAGNDMATGRPLERGHGFAEGQSARGGEAPYPADVPRPRSDA